MGPANWYYAISPDGYINNKLGLLWLEKVFEMETASLANGQHCVLITNGHGSHNTTKFFTFCFAHNVLLLRLLAHTSHPTQLLDKGCFNTLKKY